MKCFVSSCNSDFHGYRYEGEWWRKFSAHRIPNNPVHREKWLKAIANAEKRVVNPSEINFKTVRVCSHHFRAEDYYSKNGKRFLKQSAVPTLFGDAVRTESNFEEKECPTTFVSCDDKQIVRPVAERKKTIRYAGDGANDEMTAEEALMLIPKVRVKLLNFQKTVKLQRVQIKRLRAKVESMQQIINKLSSSNPNGNIPHDE